MKLPIARLLLIPMALVGPLALSHIRVVTMGVHFKGGKVDFGVPPRRYSKYYYDSMNSYSAWRPGTDYLADRYFDDYDFEKEQRIEAERATTERQEYLRARNQEIAKNYRGALSTYRSILRKGLGDLPQTLRHISILKSVDCREATGLSRLLSADLIRSRNTLRPLPAKVDPRLRIFVEYLRADRLCNQGKFSQSAKVLYRAARTDLADPWVEESLIMAARNALQAGASPTLDDQHVADASLRLLLKAFPESRFRPNAFGWLGRIDFLNSRTAAAVRHYRIWAGLADSAQERCRAFESIALTYDKAGRPANCAAWYLRRYVESPIDGKQAAVRDFARIVDKFGGSVSRKFWRLLAQDQDLLGAYLDYRLNFTEATPDLLSLGNTGIDAKTRERLPPHVRAKLAEAALRLKDPVTAHNFATSSLAMHPKADDADLAHFILGTLALRKGRRIEARAYYRQVANRHPAGYLAGGAKENLAIIAERDGDLVRALELYDDLGYKQDFAYLADARLTPAQLAAYTRRPDARQKDVLIYTLGMRYLRLGEWDNAEQTFQRLTRKKRRSLTAPDIKYGWEWIKDQGGLQDPWSTLEALRSLDLAAKRAHGNEARAQAMLNLANYYYTHRYLLLYSIPLWLGERTDSIAFSWNADIATPADDFALARHHDEHECFAHALRICKEIVRKYPHTKAAFHAAYRGATAAERLAHMAPYWRWQNSQRDYLGQSVALMKKAAKSKEPELSRKARKYEGVFADDRIESRNAFGYTRPTQRRWSPGW